MHGLFDREEVEEIDPHIITHDGERTMMRKCPPRGILSNTSTFARAPWVTFWGADQKKLSKVVDEKKENHAYMRTFFQFVHQYVNKQLNYAEGLKNLQSLNVRLNTSMPSIYNTFDAIRRCVYNGIHRFRSQYRYAQLHLAIRTGTPPFPGLDTWGLASTVWRFELFQEANLGLWKRTIIRLLGLKHETKYVFPQNAPAESSAGKHRTLLMSLGGLIIIAVFFGKTFRRDLADTGFKSIFPMERLSNFSQILDLQSKGTNVPKHDPGPRWNEVGKIDLPGDRSQSFCERWNLTMKLWMSLEWSRVRFKWWI